VTGVLISTYYNTRICRPKRTHPRVADFSGAPASGVVTQTLERASGPAPDPLRLTLARRRRPEELEPLDDRVHVLDANADY